MRALVEGSRVQKQGSGAAVLDGAPAPPASETSKGRQDLDRGCMQECEVSVCLMEMNFLQDGWLWDT